MPDVENNMDELLRKSAENYGLKGGDSQWDAISTRLIYKPLQDGKSKQKGIVKKSLVTSILILLFLVTGDVFRQNDIHLFNTIAKEIKPGNHEERNTASATVMIPAGDKVKTAYAVAENKITTVIKQAPGIGYTYNNTSIAKIVRQQNEPVFPAQGNYKPVLQTKEITGNTVFNIAQHNFPDSSTTTIDSTVNNKNESVPASANAGKNTTENKTGFYFGLVAGASFNVVKHQGLRKPGLEIGFTAGYQLNKKISIETGLLFAGKSYYSDGKYFSMKKVSGTMPQGMQVLSLEGSSQLLQIPLHVKYNLSQKKNNTVYAAAGISSSVLLKEKNNYHTLLNGDEQQITSIYSNSSGYFAGTVDIAAGYEFKMHNKANFRIEPYVQIPLKGIGVGALPVTSTGLRIGFIFPSH